jgi:hypothetical protein
MPNKDYLVQPQIKRVSFTFFPNKAKLALLQIMINPKLFSNKQAKQDSC